MDKQSFLIKLIRKFLILILVIRVDKNRNAKILELWHPISWALILIGCFTYGVIGFYKGFKEALFDTIKQ
jgi:hypothetical protein